MTKALLPTIIGLEAPGPGISVFQARFAPGDQDEGTAVPEVAIPVPIGPRNLGQSSADTVNVNKNNANTIKMDCRYIKFSHGGDGLRSEKYNTTNKKGMLRVATKISHSSSISGISILNVENFTNDE